MPVLGRVSASEQWFVHYEDDGPSGPCGQSVGVTARWSRLYVFDSHESLRAFTEAVRSQGTGRRRARISNVWSTEDGNVFVGPKAR